MATMPSGVKFSIRQCCLGVTIAALLAVICARVYQKQTIIRALVQSGVGVGYDKLAVPTSADVVGDHLDSEEISHIQAVPSITQVHFLGRNVGEDELATIALNENVSFLFFHRVVLSDFNLATMPYNDSISAVTFRGCMMNPSIGRWFKKLRKLQTIRLEDLRLNSDVAIAIAEVEQARFLVLKNVEMQSTVRTIIEKAAPRLELLISEEATPEAEPTAVTLGTTVVNQQKSPSTRAVPKNPVNDATPDADGSGNGQ